MASGLLTVGLKSALQLNLTVLLDDDRLHNKITKILKLISASNLGRRLFCLNSHHYVSDMVRVKYINDIRN